MDEADRVSRLIGDIYDATLDRSRWTGVLEKTCNYVGGAASALQSHDAVQRNASFFYSWNDNPEFTKSYQETYARINPVIVPALLQTQAGDVSTYLDFISLEEMRETQIYKEWTAPQGYLDAVQATLEKSRTSFAAVAVMLDERQSPVSEEARQRMKRLAPHFQRAVTIGKVIESHKADAATFADALDGLAAGLFLLDAAGRIVHANARGLAMLEEGSVVRAAGGRLAAVDARAEQSLQGVCASLAAGDLAADARSADFPLTGRDGERHVAHLLSLASGDRRRAGAHYSAVVAVFVRKAVLKLPHPIETLAVAYGLTAAEMRVLMLLVEIGGVPEIAPALGVSETTVKSHLQRIFQKTGARRQAELVKLVSGYLSPLS